MPQSIVDFAAGAGLTGSGTYAGTLDGLIGYQSLIVENYMSVNMVFNDEQIPPVTRRVIHIEPVIPSVEWHIVKPVNPNLTIQEQRNRVIATEHYVNHFQQPLFPSLVPYGIDLASGAVSQQWVASSIVFFILDGDGNWANPCLLGMECVWSGITVNNANAVFSFKYHHIDSATVPFFKVPIGSGASGFIPLPGVAAIETPDLTGQGASAEVSVTFYVGWITV